MSSSPPFFSNVISGSSACLCVFAWGSGWFLGEVFPVVGVGSSYKKLFLIGRLLVQKGGWVHWGGFRIAQFAHFGGVRAFFRVSVGCLGGPRRSFSW